MPAFCTEGICTSLDRFPDPAAAQAAADEADRLKHTEAVRRQITAARISGPEARKPPVRPGQPLT